MGNKNQREKEVVAEELPDEEKELLKFHKKIRREVIGCMKCVKQILPIVGNTENGRSGWGYVCGTCRESFWICNTCIHQFKKPESTIFEHKPHHRLFREPVDLQLNMLRIKAECKPDTKTSSSEIMRRCFEKYHTRWMLGERLDSEEEFAWKTYSTVLNEADSLFYGMKRIFGEDQEKNNQNFCLLFGASSTSWYVSYYSMILNDVPLVPLSEDTTSEQLQSIIEKVDPKLIIISIHLKKVLVESLKAKSSSKSGNQQKLGVIWMYDSPLRYHHQTDNYSDGVTPFKEKKWNEIVELGKENMNLEREKKITTIHPDQIRLLLSSSGTTGKNPKLVIVTESMVKQKCIPPFQGIRTVMFCIKPLRQTFNLISKGGRIGIFTSLTDVSKDLKLVRPTIFGSTPSFFLRLYEDFKSELRQQVTVGEEEEEEDGEFRKELSKKWTEKCVLGNRCRVVIIGGAASSKDLRSFIFDSLGAVCIDGYGTTETGAVSSSGSVLKGVKLLLVDSPEFGYYTSDEPYPRGEIVVNTGKGMTCGYFGDEEATKKQFLKIGGVRYSRTGDIGVMRDGKVAVIDRIKSLFKLRNGVFVAPASIECVYETSPFVRNVFIWGNSSMSSVVSACVVVNRKKKYDEDEDEEGCDDKEEMIRRDFARLARENGFDMISHVPKVIVVDRDPWTIENGLLNTAGKPVRSKLINKYRQKLLTEWKKKQTSIDGSSDNMNRMTTNEENEEQVKQRIEISSDLQSGLVKILRDVFPRCVNINNSSTPLYSLDGADSLSFARLVGSIRRKFNSKITLHQLFTKCRNLGDVQRIMFDDSRKNVRDDEERGTKNESFWNSEVEFALRELERISEFGNYQQSLQQRKTRPLRVLLTGARGFLGSFLLSELIKHGTKVVCVLRSPSSGHELENILERIKGESDLKSSFTTLEGDITKIGFGVSEEEISEAFQSIEEDNNSEFKMGPDTIIHCAAYVGSSVPYSSLRPHNVLGTVHATALARKYNSRFLQVSTVGFLPPENRKPKSSEDEMISCSHLHRLGSYAQSKWVSDQFVLKIPENIIPPEKITVVRVGTCFGARGTGIANPKDSLIRLVSGLRREKMIFSDTDLPSNLPTAFRLLPVDWVAKRIIQSNNLSEKKKNMKKKKRVACMNSPFQTSLQEIMRVVEDECGVVLDQVSSDRFRKRMMELASSGVEEVDHPLYVFASTLSSSSSSSPSNMMMSFSQEEEEEEEEEEEGEEEEIEYPRPDIRSAVRWMISVGMIEKEDE